MTTNDRPTGTFKVLYDDAAELHEHIDGPVDTNVLALRDLVWDLLDDLEEARKVIAVVYERLYRATEAIR